MTQVQIMRGVTQTHGGQFDTEAQALEWIAQEEQKKSWGEPGQYQVVIKEVKSNQTALSRLKKAYWK